MIRYKSQNRRTELKTDIELFLDTWYYDMESFMNIFPFPHYRLKNAIRAYCLLWRGIMSKKSLTK